MGDQLSELLLLLADAAHNLGIDQIGVVAAAATTTGVATTAAT